MQTNHIVFGPHDPAKRDRAKEMRLNMTGAEKTLSISIAMPRGWPLKLTDRSTTAPVRGRRGGPQCKPGHTS
jgi:hypothetical protein